MPDLLLAAVLCALAGARRGNHVAAVGVTPTTATALLAAAEAASFVHGDADVVVAGAAYEVPGALQLLAPGGRFVAVAADASAAARVAGAAGLTRLHVVPVGGAVAWSAVRPGQPARDAPHQARDIVSR